jgi:hypothetical protein
VVGAHQRVVLGPGAAELSGHFGVFQFPSIVAGTRER